MQSNPSVLQATVFVTNPVSVLSVNSTPSSVLVLNPVSVLAVNPSPASVQVLNPVSILATTQSGIHITSVISSTPSSMLVGASVFGNVGISGTPTFLQSAGSILAVTSPANQSIAGTVDVSQISTWRVSVISSTPSSMLVGASIFGQLPAGTAPLGSVATLQGTNPWVNTNVGSIITIQVGSVITVWKDSSVMAYQLAGSILATSATITPAENQSVSGTVIVTQGTSPWLTNQGGSVIAVLQSSSLIARVTGSVVTLGVAGSIAAVSATAPAGSIMATNQVAGSVMAVATGSVAAWLQSNSASIIAVVSAGAISVGSVSGTVGASIIGQLPAGTAPIGSVAVLQGTNPWIVNFANSSIIAINAGSVVTIVPGSVITIQQAQSIVGTYAEDAGHTTGDKGIFNLNVRNDAMSSITSADGDYTPAATGPVGETIIANSPITKWVQGVADFRQGNAGASIQLIATGGTSIFTYITGIQIANMGSASVLVTLASSGSTLGYSIAPAGGGSNIIYPNALKSPSNGNFAASISGIASVLVSAQGFISKV